MATKSDTYLAKLFSTNQSQSNMRAVPEDGFCIQVSMTEYVQGDLTLQTELFAPNFWYRPTNQPNGGCYIPPLNFSLYVYNQVQYSPAVDSDRSFLSKLLLGFVHLTNEINESFPRFRHTLLWPIRELELPYSAWLSILQDVGVTYKHNVQTPKNYTTKA